MNGKAFLRNLKDYLQKKKKIIRMDIFLGKHLSSENGNNKTH